MAKSWRRASPNGSTSQASSAYEFMATGLHKYETNTNTLSTSSVFQKSRCSCGEEVLQTRALTQRLVARDAQPAPLLAKRCFRLMNFKQPHSHSMHQFPPLVFPGSCAQRHSPTSVLVGMRAPQCKPSHRRKNTPSTV